MPADILFGVVTHHAQRLVDGVVAHALVLVVFAGKNKGQMPGEGLDLFQYRNRLIRQRHNVLDFHFRPPVREAHVFDLFALFRDYP
ncbi:hypothetical protein HmCmsJML100_01388 [Escherichia coli]|nr:hypothetical protein HmCmsJML100_01388 [Escherichia coli]